MASVGGADFLPALAATRVVSGLVVPVDAVRQQIYEPIPVADADLRVRVVEMRIDGAN